MANYETLKAAIQQVVKTNGNNEITGALLQQSLLAMINSLGDGFQYMGIATPTTNPGTPDQNVFYIASTAGIYANFASIVLAVGEIAILKYNGTWEKDLFGAASLEMVNHLTAEIDGGGDFTTVDFSRLEQISISIDVNGKWAGTTYYGYFIPVNPGQIVKITNGVVQNGYYTVLQDNAHLAQTTPNYANGYSGRVIIDADKEFIIPENGHYIYCIGRTSSGIVDNTYEIGNVIVGLNEKFDNLANIVNDQERDIQNINDTINGFSEERIIQLDLSQYTQYRSYIVRSTGKWTDDSNAGCIMIPATPGEIYTLIGPTASAANFAILRTNAHVGGTVPDFSTQYPSLIRLEGGATQTITIPSDGNFLYTQVKTSTGATVPLGINQHVTITSPGLNEKVSELDERVTALENDTPTPSNTELQQVFDSLPVAIDGNGWEIPTTPGMVFALKKAAQASQIVYNALANYPSLSSPTGAPAGEHTGFPYSSTKEIRKFIGWEVSFRTFMTAVQNVYGMFYTEDISAAHGQSDYGYTYNGTNCGPIYAMVCSIFTGYCLGFEIPWDTDQLAYLAKIGMVVKIEEQTPQGVHICDLVWYSGHCVLVTGVQRDQYGNVIQVQITESLGAVNSTNFTSEQFETYLHVTHNCIIYRPTTVYKNNYKPSEFVAVRGESEPTPYVYNYDICHYAGDYAAMRTDQPTWINYTLGNYTGMKIYKGDTLLATITVDGSLHKVNISSYMTGAGKYSACLTDGVTDSDFTHWQIVDAGCIYEVTGAKQKISFSSTNGVPWWVQVCSNRGVAYCWYQPTDEDIANGYCLLDLNAMIAEQYSGTPAATTYVRVMYKSEYGGVASQMIQR